MTFQWAAGILAGLCSAGSVVPYVRGILAGNRPSPVSWVLWAPVCAIWTVALFLAGGRRLALSSPHDGRAAIVLTVTEAAGSALIAVLAWRAARRRAPAGGDALDADSLPRWLAITTIVGATVALLTVAASVAGWLAIGPAVAVGLLIAVDIAGVASTVHGVWYDPTSESLLSWSMYGAGEALTIVAAIGAPWEFWGSAAFGLAGALAIIGAALRYGEKARLPQWVLQREDA